MADINKFTTKEVLNKVLLDSSGDAVNAYSHTSQEALNTALDAANNRLNVSLKGGTISGDVTISGDLTVSGSNTYAYDEIVEGRFDVLIDAENGGVTTFIKIIDADTDTTANTRSQILFSKYSSGTSAVDAGSIDVGVTQWDTTSSNRHTYMTLNTVNAGNIGERVRITNTGNVGIGNATPGSFYNSKLVVGAGSGEENLTIYAGSSNASGLFFADGTSGNARFSGQVYYNHDTNKMQFATNYSGSSSYSLTIDSNGRAGVNVPSPAQTLAVQGDTYDNIGILAGTDVFGLITCHGSDIAIKASNSNAIQFHASGSSRFKLDTNSRISLSNNDSGTQNTVFGYSAGNSLDAGSNYNVFIGHNVAGGATLADATDNTAVGYSALANLTEGDDNTAVGKQALLNLSTGARNTAVGQGAGDGLTTAHRTVIIGDSAGSGAMTTGGSIPSNADGTVAIGYSALYALTNAHGNVAIGYQAGAAVTGSLNTIVGYQAADALASGTSNTVIGGRAMGAANGGEQNNVIIGTDAGDVINDDAADGNVIIGQDADPSSSAGTNQIVIGQGATGQANNSVTLGNGSVTKVYMSSDGDAEMYANGTINTSDKRLKENINDSDLGLSFVNALRPVSYKFIDDKKPEKLKYGIIAQEVQEVLKESGNEDFAGITDKGDYLGADYVQFIAPLIKAVQELSAKVEALEAK